MTEKFGIPFRVRGDQDVENVQVAKFMITMSSIFMLINYMFVVAW